MQTARTSNRTSSLPEPSLLPSIHRLQMEHSLYERRLDTLHERPYLTEPERMEEVRLKKLKLHLKDQMERLRRPDFSQTPS